MASLPSTKHLHLIVLLFLVLEVSSSILPQTARPSYQEKTVSPQPDKKIIICKELVEDFLKGCFPAASDITYIKQEDQLLQNGEEVETHDLRPEEQNPTNTFQPIQEDRKEPVYDAQEPSATEYQIPETSLSIDEDSLQGIPDHIKKQVLQALNQNINKLPTRNGSQNDCRNPEVITLDKIYVHHGSSQKGEDDTEVLQQTYQSYSIPKHSNYPKASYQSEEYVENKELQPHPYYPPYNTQTDQYSQNCNEPISPPYAPKKSCFAGECVTYNKPPSYSNYHLSSLFTPRHTDDPSHYLEALHQAQSEQLDDINVQQQPQRCQYYNVDIYHEP